MLQAELKILGGKHQGKLIPLNFKKFLVGREQDCHLRPNSDLVSRHHCVFSIDEYSVRLRDLGSTNGTLVNGKNARGEVILKAGDRITIGKLELEVVIRHTASKLVESRTPPPAIDLPSVASVSESPTPSGEIETSYELAVFQGAPPPETPPEVPADTAIIGSPQSQLPQQPQPMVPGYPPGYPNVVPPGYPMPGAYMPPQYPQYPPMPGYGQPAGYGQPMGYPMAYPPVMPPAYPAAAIVAPVAPAAIVEPAVEAPAKVEEIAVRLPNPEETGAKPANPPIGSGGSGGGAAVEKPSTTAADIIKQYMSKRS